MSCKICMSSKICDRMSCIPSFHGIKEQENYEKYENYSALQLISEILDRDYEIIALNNEIAGLNNEIKSLRKTIKELLNEK